ncbi:MAG: winged helix-turn-helix transcriptional regulator [Armatimonadetes bacterium]|nr:winged helix-turn-helix transcriptional regulator [Armatimonadota bacterium]NDK10686.1 winged helix-turn-helix transcriptional regulator [Armatimonadota bacterium]
MDSQPFETFRSSVSGRSETCPELSTVVVLTAREYALLEFLALRAGQAVSRDEIWDHAYDFGESPGSNVVDPHVGHLRRKLEAGGLSRLLHTRRGTGYVLSEDR